MVDKLVIEPQSPSALKPITVQFNPNAYTVAKAVTWSPETGAGSAVAGGGGASPAAGAQNDRRLNAPKLAFGGGAPRALTLQLFFDVTEDPVVTDVRVLTNPIVKLTRIESGQDGPPVCLVKWGPETVQGSDFPFRGVVTNLSQNFTLFRSTGEPVRASLTVTFTEAIDEEADRHETDPELTTHVVKRGDSLSSIAGKHYRDPTRWRDIAAANRIDDPLRLPIGKRLSIPS